MSRVAVALFHSERTAFTPAATRAAVDTASGVYKMHGKAAGGFEMRADLRLPGRKVCGARGWVPDDR